MIASVASTATIATLATQSRWIMFDLRLGAEPMNADELAPIFPPLPLPPIARRINKAAAWDAGRHYNLVGGPHSQPAEQIPELDLLPDP